MKTTQPRRPARPVRKADEKLPVAVYDQKGRLVGIVMDPDAIKPVANSSPDVDLEPAPAAEVGTPADGVAKTVAKLKKAVYGSPDPAERDQAADLLNRAAIIALDRIHGRRPPRGASPGRGGHVA